MRALLEFRVLSVSDCGEFEIMCLAGKTFAFQDRDKHYTSSCSKSTPEGSVCNAQHFGGKVLAKFSMTPYLVVDDFIRRNRSW